MLRRLLPLMLFAFVFGGCGGSSEEVGVTPGDGNDNSMQVQPVPPPPPPPADSAEEPAPEYAAGKNRSQPAALNAVLTSWRSGDKDGAVEQMLSVDWRDPATFGGISVLDVSEQEIASLSQDDRTRILEEAIELYPKLKNLSRHAIAIGDNAQASGDKQAARKHYEAALHLGQALSSPERLLIFEKGGVGMVRVAGEKLATLK